MINNLHTLKTSILKKNDRTKTYTRHVMDISEHV